jgi:endonuclease/exonuclease/phosphatase family metal-dependent hydrolase
MKYIFVALSFAIVALGASAQKPLTFVELNCENLFDCADDTLKSDEEFTPGGVRHWTQGRYWRKLNNMAQAIVSCTPSLPDLVALVEVENDSVLHALTRRSLLRNAGYDYLMTSSPDLRGIDVALLYRPQVFLPLCYDMLVVTPLPGMRPTRDILYVKGCTVGGDTLHVFVVHAPSRFGGERASRPFRRRVAEVLASAIDSLYSSHPDAHIIVAGDFNTTLKGHSLQYLLSHRLESATPNVKGSHGAQSNYRYRGRWEQIDHVLVSPTMSRCVVRSFVNDSPFLLIPDEVYGGMKPFRTFNGYRYEPGFSDHLPVVVCFDLSF